ncbi:MAG: hypothetical protein WCJ64_25505 [Rhodospirillaceae bacterium]
MAVRPRIKTAPPLTEADETIVSAIINRGGAPATHESPPAPGAVPSPAPPPHLVDAEKKFTLRLPASLLAEIEKDAKDRPDRISVNTWLIGAALQRLNRGDGR